MPAIRKPRKPVGSSLKQWGAGIGALHNAGIAYNAQAGQYTERPKPQSGMSFSPEDIAAQQARARQRATRALQITDEGTNDVLNYNEQLRRYRENLPRQQRQALQGANKAGLAQSTVLAQEQADNATQAARGEADMTSAYNERNAAREAARRMLEQGGEIEDADALVESALRRTTEASGLAEQNALASTAPVAQSRIDSILAPVRSAAAAPRAPGVSHLLAATRRRNNRRTPIRRPRSRR